MAHGLAYISAAIALSASLSWPAAARAEPVPTATIAEMAATPLVHVNIAESLRTPPDEATITVGTTVKATTATATAAASKLKTEKLLAAIRAAGIRERDIQTQGIQLQQDYRWESGPGGQGHQIFLGYVARNSIKVKSRNIDKLTALLDALTAGGADFVYGPTFTIADPAPLKHEARLRALERGKAEAMEYALSNGYKSVRLLSVEEGTSYRGSDVTLSATGISIVPPAPAPPPPPGGAERDSVVAPGQLETSVSLNLIYRMER